MSEIEEILGEIGLGGTRVYDYILQEQLAELLSFFVNKQQHSISGGIGMVLEVLGRRWEGGMHSTYAMQLRCCAQP